MSKFVKIFICCLVIMFSFTFCAGSKVHQYKVQVVKEYPHDPASYTQGLFFYDGEMYETTGQYGESTLRKVDIATGKALKQFNFDRKYFLEGSVVLNGNLYILTWTNKVAFVYDAATLQYKATYSYPREGWGLTTDGKSLIASDGSSRIYFLDENFKQQKVLTVKMNGRSLNMLNELEYVDGKIWANVYMTDMIVIINPSSGIVEGAIDCTGLLPQSLRDDKTDVLNGIAYNPADGKIYLTGNISPEIIPNEPDAVNAAVGKRNLKHATLVAPPCININTLCEVLFFMQHLCCSLRLRRPHLPEMIQNPLAKSQIRWSIWTAWSCLPPGQENPLR